MKTHPILADLRKLSEELHMAATVEAPDTLLSNVLYRVGLVDVFWSMDTAIGPVFVAASVLGISAVARGADSAAFADAHEARTGRSVRRLDQAPERLMQDVTSVLSGDRSHSPDFDLRGLTEFVEAVLRKALEIPRGEVRPYGWVAREIGHPGAARAVGTALANNPAPLLIPCHRVVRGDGVFGNYIFGTDAKVAMLESEDAGPARLATLAQQGVRFAGSDTTKIFCFPSCRNARRITDQHLVAFKSDRKALDAGYRPCKVCRPAIAS